MNLTHAQEGTEYIVRDIVTHDEEMDAFLFSLGCYSGEPITVISRRKNLYIVSNWELLTDGLIALQVDLGEHNFFPCTGASQYGAPRVHQNGVSVGYVFLAFVSGGSGAKGKNLVVHGPLSEH